MIEDDELRELFRVESAEALEQLEQGLLRLETAPTDGAHIDTVFRSAHNLKGSARMLGLTALESLMHALEDLLGKARRSEVALTSSRMDGIGHCLDAVQQYTQEAVDGTPPDVALETALAHLDVGGGEPGAASVETPEPDPVLVPIAEDEWAPPALPPLAGPPLTITVKPRPSSADAQLSTLRVDPRHLDRLMALAAEIRVLQTRLAEHVAELEPVLASKTEASLQRSLTEDSTRMEVLSALLDERVRGLRLVPLSVLFNPFARMVRDLSRHNGKQVDLAISGGDLSVDKQIVETMKAPLMHLLRNAIDHGFESESERLRAGKREAGTLSLRGFETGRQVVLEVQDDGRGIDPQRVRQVIESKNLLSSEALDRLTEADLLDLVFTPGFSTRGEVTALSGRGVGLDVVRNHAERLRGIASVTSVPGQGTTFSIRLPTTVLTASVLVVQVGGQWFGLPAESVRACVVSPRHDIFTIEGQPSLARETEVVPLFELGNLLGMVSGLEADPFTCVVLESGRDRAAVVVDAAMDVREVVTKPLGRFLTRVRNVFGVTILGGGEVCLLLRPSDLLRQATGTVGRALSARRAPVPAVRKHTVLLAEDSLVTRVQEKRILEAAGFDVVVAVDGLDALNKLSRQTVDALVTDVEMPGLDGLGLTRRLRDTPRYQDLPIILVTSLASDDDRQRGLEAGANAYITKSAFDQTELLETLRRLL